MGEMFESDHINWCMGPASLRSGPCGRSDALPGVPL